MRRLTALFATSVFVLAFGACSGDEPLSTGRTTTTTEEEDDEETTTTTEEEGGTTTTTEEDDGGGGEVCATIEALNDAEDPESLEDLAAFIDDFSGLRDQLPDDLGDDLEIFSDFFLAVLAAADENGGDIDGALQEVFESLDEDDIAAIEDATTALDEFGEEECGIDPDGGDDPETSTTSTTDGSTGSTEELGDPSPPPDLEDPEEIQLAQQCFEGDLEACDDLWLTTPGGSDGEAYAETCGGRVESGDQFATCVENFG